MARCRAKTPFASLDASTFAVCTEDGSLIGSAFAISERTAITCAHVVEGRNAKDLSLRRGELVLHIDSFELHPDSGVVDLAVLSTTTTLPFAVSTTRSDVVSQTVSSIGFSAMDTVDASRIDFDLRHPRDVEYRGDIRAYRVTNVLELAGDPAFPGNSGAPVLDGALGAVVAVVIGGSPASRRTWAIRLGAAARWPAAQAALEWNSANCPRYGKAVNYSGALVATRLQIKREIAVTRQMGKYDPAWNVRRRGIYNSFSEFCIAPSTILAIVGDANVGKTWLLCELARQQAGKSAHISLAVGFAIDRAAPKHLEAMITESLKSSWREAHGEAVPDMDAAAIAGACRAAGAPLVVFLDGVNEALDVPQFLGSWWPQAIGWCEEHGAKVVFTTRPEPWPMIFAKTPDARRRLHSPSKSDESFGAEARALWIRDFNAEEAADAQVAYKVDAADADTLGQHPLMFRIFRELGGSSAVRETGRFRLVKMFIEHLLLDAASSLGLMSAESLWTAVEAVAEALPRDGSGSIDATIVSQSVGGNNVLDALLGSGVLVRQGRQVRFRFDEMADILRPGHFNIDAWLTSLSPDSNPEPSSLLELFASTLRLEFEGPETSFLARHELLVTTLARIAESLIKSQYEGNSCLGSLVVAAQRIADALPRRRVELRDKLVPALLRCERALGSFWVRDLTEWILEANVAAATRADWILQNADLHAGWMWRWQDWADTSRRCAFEESMEHSRYPGGANYLNDLLRSGGEGVQTRLIEALADERRARRHDGDISEGSVASFVAGVLFFRRMDNLPRLARELSDANNANAGNLLYELARDQPDGVISALTAASAEYVYQRSVSIVGEFGRRATLETRTAALAWVKQLQSSGNSAVARAALNARHQLDPSDVESWDAIASSIEYDEQYGYSALLPVPPERLTSLDPLATRLPKLTLGVIGRTKGDAAQEATLCAIATKILREDSGDDKYRFGALAETKLNEWRDLATDAVGELPWFGFAREAMQFPSARCPIAYALFSKPLCFVALREEFLQVATKRDLGQVVELICRYSLSEWADLPNRLRRIDAESFDYALLRDVVMASRSAIRQEVWEFWSRLPPDAHTYLSTAIIAQAGDLSPEDALDFKHISKLGLLQRS